jgi:predicted Zn-dependent protease
LRSPKSHIRLAALLVAIAACSGVRAACPGDAGEPLPAPDKLQALEDTLAPLAAECGRHAGYLAYRGAVLNALGRHAEAALLLEQALLLDPARAGAQIDYAEALAALGDNLSAAAMLRDVAARPLQYPL